MFFKRQKGKFHEVERVTRFKLIKSGKHWLRAATSQFGLFRLMKGADLSSVEVKVTEEQATDKISGLDFLKGIVATGAVLGGAVVTSATVYAEEDQALEKVIDTNDVLATRGETVLGEEATAASAESVQSADTGLDSASASVSASVSASLSASTSQSESLSLSSSASLSASLSQSVSESASASESLSVSASVSQSLSESVAGSQSQTAGQSSVSASAETSSNDATSSANQSARVRKRRDVANATDTERPVVDFQGK